MNPQRFDAIGRVPGAHLGLCWSGVQESDLAEIAELVQSCELSDGVVVATSAARVRPTFLPTGEGHVAMVGRDSAGELRAAGSVRHLHEGGWDSVAIMASISPRWRGRGIGRAVLAWQDAWGIEMLRRTGRSGGMISAAIPSRMMDRRRLHAAAGFSSGARLEHYVHRLCDFGLGAAPAELAPPGWEIRPFTPADADELLALRGELPADRNAVRALSQAERIALADPAISRLAFRDGTLRGVLLAHPTVDREGRAVATIHDLLLVPPDDDVGAVLLASAWRKMCQEGLSAAHIRLTPHGSAQWAPVLTPMDCTLADVELVYSIEVQ